MDRVIWQLQVTAQSDWRILPWWTVTRKRVKSIKVTVPTSPGAFLEIDPTVIATMVQSELITKGVK